MNASDLLDLLYRRGVDIEVHGDKLRLRGPKRILTPELRQLVAERKPEIMALLQDDIHPGDIIGLANGDQYVVLYALEHSVVTATGLIVSRAAIRAHWPAEAAERERWERLARGGGER